jgi:2,4-dienoyl-CoA reductase (NADPH2)
LDGCTNRLFDGVAIGCVLNPVTGRELEIGNPPKAEVPKDVLVIGGGLGGMQAAIAASRVGHRVRLLEKSDRLGGQLNLACVPPHKEKIGAARDWFAGELVRRGVEVKLNCAADLEKIELLNPDAVIVATGAVPVTDIPVKGLEYTVQGWDILSGKSAVPKNAHVAIIGGGIVGCEIAELLLEKENSVSIIEMLPSIANGLEVLHTVDLMDEFTEKHVDIQVNARVVGISAGSVTFVRDERTERADDGTKDNWRGVRQGAVEKDGKSENAKEETIKADMVVLAVGQKSVGLELVRSLKEAGYKTLVVGDAKKPAKFIDATRDGYFAGLAV